MKFIEIQRASNGWLVYYTQRQSLGADVKIFMSVEDAINYIRELMSKK